MKSRITSAIFLGLGLAVAGTAAIRGSGESANVPQIPNTAPVLINTCLVTNDVLHLTAFYSQVLQIEPHREGGSYVEFRTSAGVLALFAAEAQQKYIPGSAAAGQNRSSILEFRVGDVDSEYRRLLPLVKGWVKGPTTQPWGTRSIYFRDPDGNLVDFFSPMGSP